MKKRKALNLILKYLQIIIGSAIYAAGFQYIMFPNSVTTGGDGGIAMIINRFTAVPVGALIILINIPLFIISARKLGWRFMISTLVGMVASSVLIDFFALFPHVLTTEPLLICVYGGIMTGIGLGIVYRTGATTGGTDIIAKLIRVHRPYLNLGTIMLILDIIIIGIYALIFDSVQSALYALIAMFISSKSIDLVLYGADNAKLCFIITDKADDVKDYIFSTLDRGVTFLHGQGGFTGNAKKVILCAIYPRQIAVFRKAIKSIAPDAFIIITDAHEVFGDGFDDVSDIK